MKMDIQKTSEYYQSLGDESLCSCDYCRNYYKEIRGAYPELSDCLAKWGIDIEKPFEAMPLEPYEGQIEYIAVQYIVMGNDTGFEESDVFGVHIGLADSHPMTDIAEDHFVIELAPITLKWTMDGSVTITKTP